MRCCPTTSVHSGSPRLARNTGWLHWAALMSVCSCGKDSVLVHADEGAVRSEGRRARFHGEDAENGRPVAAATAAPLVEPAQRLAAARTVAVTFVGCSRALSVMVR